MGGVGAPRFLKGGWEAGLGEDWLGFRTPKARQMKIVTASCPALKLAQLALQCRSQTSPLHIMPYSDAKKLVFGRVRKYINGTLPLAGLRGDHNAIIPATWLSRFGVPPGQLAKHESENSLETVLTAPLNHPKQPKPVPNRPHITMQLCGG